jgi:tetratricopeptide (TPR) repeat protein
MKTKQINKVFSVVTLLAIIFLLAEFALALPKTSNESLPSSPEVLKQEAQDCIQKKDYSEARQIYKKIMTTWPKSDFALKAQKKLIILDITTGSEEMLLAIGKFLADHVYYHAMNWSAFQEIASYYKQQQDIKKIIKSHQNVLNKHPSKSCVVWAQSSLAVYYISLNEDAKAEAAVKKLLADYANHPDIAGGISLIAKHYRASKTDRAIELYQYILSNHPSDFYAMRAQSDLGICYLLQNKNVKAEAAVEKLLTDYTNHPDIAVEINRIANNYRDRKKYGNAIELYQHILSKYPSDPQAMRAQFWLAVCYIQMDRDEEVKAAAEKLLTSFSNHPNIIVGISRIADNYRARGKPDNAMELYQHALSKYPSDPQTMQAQSAQAVCYIQMDRDEEAKAAVEKLLTSFSNHPNIAVGIIRCANSYIHQRKHDKRDKRVKRDKYYKRDNAIELYQHILSKYPSAPQAMQAQSWLAVCYIQTDRDEEAKAAVEKLLTSFSNHPRIIAGITRIANNYLYLGKLDNAIELYQRILSKYPSDTQAMRAQSALAVCYIQMGRDEEAKAAVEKLLADFSNYPNIIVEIGYMADNYRIREKPDNAIELYQRILSKYPSAPQAMQAQSSLAICYIQMGRDEEAKAAVEKLLTDFSNHFDFAGTIAETIKYYVEHFEESETLFDALNRFMAKLPNNPDSINIVNEIAEGCHESEKDEIAVKLYQTYLSDYALESNKEETELKLYKSMYLAGMDLEKVRVSLDKYINRVKETNTSLVAEALALRGQLFAKLGEVDKAINDFLMLKNEYPETKGAPEASFFVGYYYMLQGKFEQAKEVLNLVVKNYPQSSYASKAKLYLTRIESMTE